MITTGAGQSMLLLTDVVAILDQHDIEYAVIGALAASVHGMVRATADADALISVSQPELKRLGNVLRKAGFATELRKGGLDDPIPVLLAISDRFANRVDLLGGLRGFDPQAFKRTVAVSFSGSALRIVGLEDFIAMKCFAGGPQDVADAEEAIRSAKPPIDLDLLRRLTRRYGRAAADVLEQLITTVGGRARAPGR